MKSLRQGHATDNMDLRAFVTDLVETAGGAIDVRDDVVMDLVLPSDLAEQASLPEFVTITLDYDMVREVPGSEFVTFGSPTLDKLIRVGLQVGRVVKVYAVASAIRVPPNLMDRIESQVSFVRARRPSLRSTAIDLYEQVVFRFVVSYVSDEKFTDVATLGVDRHTLGDDTDLLPTMESAYFTDDMQMSPKLPHASCHPYREVVRAAIERLPARIQPQFARYQEQVSAFCRQELAKLLRYYHGTLEDLAARERNAQDPDRKARIGARIQASRAECERRITDVVDKYKMVAEARLDSIMVRVMPKVKARLEVQHMDRFHFQDVYYNLATNSVEPMVCPRCHKRFFVGYPSSDGTFVCSPDEA